MLNFWPKFQAEEIAEEIARPIFGKIEFREAKFEPGPKKAFLVSKKIVHD